MITTVDKTDGGETVVTPDPVGPKVKAFFGRVGHGIASGTRAVVETSPADMGRGIAKGSNKLVEKTREARLRSNAKNTVKLARKLGLDETAKKFEKVAQPVVQKD